MSNANLDLTRLLARIADGDRAAFSSLYEAISAKLFGTVVRILRRRDLAEEVLQDVFVKIWQRAGDFDAAKASPVTWMATIARNAALDVARRRSHVPIDEAPEAMQVADPGKPPQEAVELGQELSRLNRCLEGLGSERQELVRLAYLHGMSRDELAQRFKHPAGTIKTWLHRSLKQLKDCLGS